MGTSDVIATVSGTISLVAILVSVVVARSQSVLSRRQQLLPVVVDLRQEFLTPSFTVHRSFIQERLRVTCPDHAAGTRGLSPEARDHVRPVMAYFNNVGLLVVNKTVSTQLVASIMGGSVVKAWSVLAPYVYAERVHRGDDPNYYGYFEHLAVVVNEMGPKKLEGMLNLRKWPPTASPN